MYFAASIKVDFLSAIYHEKSVEKDEIVARRTENKESMSLRLERTKLLMEQKR